MSEINRYTESSLDERMRYAQTIASAGALIPTGLFENGAPSPGKVLLVMETGAMLGIHPVAALQGVHVIEGKATLSPALMSAVVRRAGHVLRVETLGSVADATFTATATLIRNDDPDHPFVVSWNLERAKRAGLAGKGPWNKYFEAMAKARAISEVCREGATDALMGVGYVPEELGADVTEAGEIVSSSVQSHTAEPIIHAPVVSAVSPSIPLDARRDSSRDWRAEADEAMSADLVLDIFSACRDAGDLDIMTEHDGKEVQMRVYLRKLGERLRVVEERERADVSVDAEVVSQPALALDASIDADTGELLDDELI